MPPRSTGPRPAGLPRLAPARWLPALAVLVAAALVSWAPLASAATPDWTKAEAVPVVGGLDMPVDIHVAPDGAIWFVELAGNVSRHDPAKGTTSLVRHVEDVVTGHERGLVGLALGADFATNGTYFLYYTKRTDDPDGGLNHLVRIRDETETILATVPGAKEHNGGRIAVAPDGTVFVGTGENQLRDPAQDPKSLLGKVLRMTPDGQGLDGNLDGLVYSKGHRNVYGLALHPETGDPWSTENSGWRRDEVNIVKAKANYGYPECEGNNLNGLPGPPEANPCPTDKGYTFPIRTFYEHDAVAPTGATFWRGEFYWASLNEGSIHHLWQDPGSKEWLDEVVFREADGKPIFDLHVGPKDDLFLSTVDGILRISLPNTDVGNPTTQPPSPGPGTTGSQSSAGSDEPTDKGAAAPSLAVLAGILGAALLLRRRQG